MCECERTSTLSVHQNRFAMNESITKIKYYINGSYTKINSFMIFMGMVFFIILSQSVDFEFPRTSSVTVWAASHVVAGMNDGC